MAVEFSRGRRAMASRPTNVTILKLRQFLRAATSRLTAPAMIPGRFNYRGGGEQSDLCR